jgi:hypothetical protein
MGNKNARQQRRCITVYSPVSLMTFYLTMQAFSVD